MRIWHIFWDILLRIRLLGVEVVVLHASKGRKNNKKKHHRSTGIILTVDLGIQIPTPMAQRRCQGDVCIAWTDSAYSTICSFESVTVIVPFVYWFVTELTWTSTNTLSCCIFFSFLLIWLRCNCTIARKCCTKQIAKRISGSRVLRSLIPCVCCFLILRCGCEGGFNDVLWFNKNHSRRLISVRTPDQRVILSMSELSDTCSSGVPTFILPVPIRLLRTWNHYSDTPHPWYYQGRI